METFQVLFLIAILGKNCSALNEGEHLGVIWAQNWEQVAILDTCE